MNFGRREQMAEWLVATVLLFGGTLETGYRVAALFLASEPE